MGFLIVTMGERMSDPNSTFFAQLFLVAPLVLSIAAAWHLTRSVRWFDGTRERQLRPEDSGARPITRPADGGWAGGGRRRRP